MANYNTFIVQNTRGGKTLLVTSSARKAKALLRQGVRIEVWSNNFKIATVHARTTHKLDNYLAAEKEYIRAKQTAAEQRNRQRRAVYRGLAV